MTNLSTARSDVERFRRDLMRWGRVNRRPFAWRETDDPFEVLIAEVLLQRSRGTTVASVHQELFRRWPTALALSRARVTTIESVIRPLGLVRRATTLKQLAQDVVGLDGVPATLDGLLALPGVGPYAAGATLAVAFGQRAHVVDGVTARVYRRYFGSASDLPPSNDKELWGLVETATPARNLREWNWAVLDLASSVCLPKVPRCSVCPLMSHCTWSQTRA